MFKVHDFVVMPNHVHVLLSLGPEMSIEKAVQMMKGKNFSISQSDLDQNIIHCLHEYQKLPSNFKNEQVFCK